MTSPLPDLADVRESVRAGLLAPSGDNCQPWQFVWDGRQLDIQFLPERAASLYDVHHAASWISLGATLTNMRVAVRQRGFHLDVRLFPSGEQGGVVATVRFQRGEPRDDPLGAALPARCVNRRAYRRDPLPARVRDELLATVRADPRASLDLVEDPERLRPLAALAARNDQILFENEALHAGLYRWLRWTPDDARRTADGMPIESLELGRLERSGFHWLASWTLAHALGAVGATQLLPLRAQRIYACSAAIGLLSVEGDRPEDFVRGGELLERLWLTATLRGVAFQPITGTTFLLLRCRMAHGAGLSHAHQRLLEQTRRELARLLPVVEQKTPVMLFRLGFAEAPTGRATRRPVETAFMVKPP